MAFNRKKGKNNQHTAASSTTAKAAEIVNLQMESVSNTARVQNELSNARDAKEGFEKEFNVRLIENAELFEDMMKTAKANAEKLEKMEERFQKALEGNSDNASQMIKRDIEEVKKDLKSRRDFYNSFLSAAEGQEQSEKYSYDSIYILPDDCDKYIRALSYFSNKFEKKSSAEAVGSGADEFFLKRNTDGDLLMPLYIAMLQDAMKTGKKLKANTCFDVFNYILEVAYEKPVTFTREQLGDAQETRLETVFETARSLLESMDDYYEQLQKLEILDDGYTESIESWNKLRLEMDMIPKEILDVLLNMDMKGAMDSLPPNSPVKEYYPLVFNGKATLTNCYMKGYEVRSTILGLTERRNEIKELLKEFRMAFVNRGVNFNQEEHIRRLQRIRKRNIDKAREREEWANQVSQMNAETMSLIEAAERNVQTGINVAENLSAMLKQKKLDQENAQLQKRIKEHQAEVIAKYQKIQNEQNEQENEQNENEPLYVEADM